MKTRITECNVIILSTLGSRRLQRITGDALLHFDPSRIISIISPPGNELDLGDLAVNGYLKLQPQHWTSANLYDPIKQRYGAGTLGCLLSHYKAYEEIISRNLPYALIVEDNIVFKPNFIQNFREVINDLEGVHWDIVSLYSSIKKDRKPFRNSLHIGDCEYGTAKAQIVSNRYAKAMMARLPFYAPADGITMIPTSGFIQANLKGFISVPHLVDRDISIGSDRIQVDNTQVGKKIYDHTFIPVSDHLHIYSISQDAAHPCRYNSKGIEHIYCLGIKLSALVSTSTKANDPPTLRTTPYAGWKEDSVDRDRMIIDLDPMEADQILNESNIQIPHPSILLDIIPPDDFAMMRGQTNRTHSINRRNNSFPCEVRGKKGWAFFSIKEFKVPVPCLQDHTNTLPWFHDATELILHREPAHAPRYGRDRMTLGSRESAQSK